MEETTKIEPKTDGNKPQRAAAAAAGVNGTASHPPRTSAPAAPAAARDREREPRDQREARETERAPRERAPVSELDQELRAMKQLGTMLGKLTPGVRARVLRYFSDKYVKGDK